MCYKHYVLILIFRTCLECSPYIQSGAMESPFQLQHPVAFRQLKYQLWNINRQESKHVELFLWLKRRQLVSHKYHSYKCSSNSHVMN